MTVTPVSKALYLKDMQCVSDARYSFGAGSGNSNIADIVTLPRCGDVITARRNFDDRLGTYFSVQEHLEPEDSVKRTTCSIAAVCKAQLWASIAEEVVPPVSQVLRYKLSFDGTDAGGKDVLAVGVIPLWDIKKVQSNKHVFPIGIAWTGESKDSLEQCVPHLTEAVSALHRDGVTIDGPDGCRRYKVEICIAADMASLWKLSGIGSASNTNSCIFCMATSAERENIRETADKFEDPANWRSDLPEIFGVPWKRVHICTLHAHTRICEKLLKVLAVRCVNSNDAERIVKTTYNKAVKGLDKEIITVSKKVKLISTKIKRAKGNVEDDAEYVSAKSTLDRLQQALAETNKTHAAYLDEKERGVSGIGAMERAVVQQGVLKKTWQIKITQHQNDADKCTVDISSLTGGQADTLLGEDPASVKARKSGAAVDRPFVNIIKAALGDCGHGLGDQVHGTAEG